MQQLSGLDALFAYNESYSTPMHIGSLSMYQTPKNNAVMTLEHVTKTVEKNLANSPVFKRKLIKMPGNIDKPYWGEQRNFDIRKHVKHLSLADQGPGQTLHTLIADLHAKALNLAQPLWQIWFINGFDGQPNKFALYMKVHHMAIDGMSGAEIFASLHSQPGDHASAIVEQKQKKPSRSLVSMLPQWTQVQIKHYSGRNERTLEKIRKLGQLGRNWQQHRKNSNETADDSANKGDSPGWVSSRFNNRIDKQRSLRVVEFDFAKLRVLRRTVPGATINHVLLTIIGGGLRKYLLSKDELPDAPLASLVPVNVRRGEQTATGNALSLLLASLHTNIENPVQRLIAVRDSATRGRDQSFSLGKNSMQLIADLLPARTAAFGLKAVSALSLLPGETRLPFNTVVSNLNIPPVPLHFNGAELQSLVCIGLLVNHMGLFHTAASYRKTLTLSVLTCETMMPDADFYAQCLEDAFEELCLGALDNQ